MASIDLRDGLVGWWTFDDVDVDAQRGELRDRSGHGNHLELEGGVTTGVEGRVGEAFSFDGSDDYGISDNTGPSGYQQELSLAALFRPDGGTSDDNTTVISWSGYDAEISENSSGEWRMGYQDDSDVFSGANGGSTDVGEWNLIVGSVGDGIQSLYQNGDLVSSKSIDKDPYLGDRRLSVMAVPNGSSISSGELAFAGVWGRKITREEILTLNRMTARRVSPL